MKRGPKPKPTNLRVIQALPPRHGFNAHEPQPVGELRDAPDWLTDAQKDGWNYAIAHAPAGLLKLLDRSVLEIWVVADDYHRQAAMTIAREGMVIESHAVRARAQFVQSPYLAIKNKQAQIMLNAAAQLGFTPSSRTQIQTAGKPGSAFANNGRRAA